MNTKTAPLLTTTPYPYQTHGATQAAWAGHNLIADEPGLGKTLQAILTHHLTNSTHTLIITPPHLVTNWANEITTTHTHPQTIHTITPKTKTTTTTTTTRPIWTITTDTLLTARPKLAQTLTNQKWDLIILDEAHRYKNPKTKRTRTITQLTHNQPHTLALTGTPILNTPLDLLPLLRILKQTHHFPPNYYDTYTRPDYWGAPVTRKDKLPDLYQRLDTHVWTRRTKQQVLTQLPPKTRHTIHTTPDMQLHDQHLTPLIESLHDHLKNGGTIEQWAKDALPHVSRLRKATGLSKVPHAVEHIKNHYYGTGRPLIVWTIHTQVAQTIHNQLQAANIRAEIINGQTPPAKKTQYVNQFQAGDLPVLICQIIAAGTGLTLTRATEALFVETDWTPANITQAEDRIHRITQIRPVTITTLIAPGTLDEVIHRVLAQNIQLLDQLTPGADHHVTTSHQTTRVSDILTKWAHHHLENEQENQ